MFSSTIDPVRTLAQRYTETSWLEERARAAERRHLLRQGRLYDDCLVCPSCLNKERAGTMGQERCVVKQKALARLIAGEEAWRCTPTAAPRSPRKLAASPPGSPWK